MAAVAAVDEDEAMAIEVDDDEVPTQWKRKRITSNKDIYDQFTDEGVDKTYDKDGSRHVYCRFMELANIPCTNLDNHAIAFAELKFSCTILTSSHTCLYQYIIVSSYSCITKCISTQNNNLVNCLMKWDHSGPLVPYGLGLLCHSQPWSNSPSFVEGIDRC
jgi:hypothetical protein